MGTNTPSSRAGRIREKAREQWRDQRPATLFLLLAAFFGLLFVFIVPPTQAADEKTHFYRSYQLSEGHILSKSFNQGYGDYLPTDVYNVSEQLFANIPSHYERTFNYRQLPHLLKQRINTKNTTAVHLEGSTVYSPIPYIPQVLAIWVAKAIWPSVVLIYYLGRLANLAVWIVLVYLAIRFWPFNKWPVFALALTPMSLSQAATLSPDALGNALAFVTISAMLYYAHHRRRLKAKDILVVFAGVVLLALCKPVFFVLGLLAFLYSVRQLGSVKRYVWFAGSLLLAGVLVTAFWNAEVKGYSAGIAHYYYPTEVIHQSQQAIHVLTHPFGFVHTLGRTYLTTLGDIVTTSFIGRLGWFDTALPIWLVVGTYIMLALAILNREPDEERFNRRTRYVSAAVFILGFLVTSVILYMTITSVGATLINNVQGRYFIAFTPLLVPPLAGLLQVKDWNKIAARIFPIGYSIILATSLLVVVNRFI